MTNYHDMTTAARELAEYMNNERDLYERVLWINGTLASHYVAGNFDIVHAARAFVRLVAVAARRYQAEHGSPFGPRIFDKRDRDQVTEYLAGEFREIAANPAIWSDLGDRAAAILAKGATS